MATIAPVPVDRAAARRRSVAAALQRVSLWPRLVIGFTLGFCVLFAVFMVVTLHAVHASSSRIVRERLVIAEMAASNIEQLLEHVRVTLAAADRDRSPARAFEALAPTAVAVYEVDRRGRLSRSIPAHASTDAALVTGRPFVERAATARRFAVSGPFRLADGRGAVAVAYHGQRGDTLVLVLDPAAPAFMRPLVESMRLGNTGHGELVGAAGYVIASTDSGDAIHPGEHRPFYREMLRRRDTDVQTVPYVERDRPPGARKLHVMAWSPVHGVPWGVAVGGTLADTFGPVQRLRRTLILAGTGTLLLLWLIALGGAHVLVRPVQKLTRAAHAMAGGDLEHPIAVTEGGEIGVLADSLESMRAQLRRWGDELELQVEGRTSELRATNRQLAAVTAVATAGSTSFDLPAMIDACLAAIIAHAGVDGASVRLLEPRTRILRPAGSQGVMSRLNCAARELAPGECPCAQAADDGTARYGTSCPSCSHDERSLAVLPLRVHGKTIGTLAVTRGSGGFAPAERRTLAAIADQLAVAVDNAQLLDELASIEAQREVQRVKSDLIAAVSHELRTPLGFIKGYSTTLLRETEIDQQTRTQFLEIIDEETSKLEAMVEDLLDASRLQSGRLEIAPQTVDIRALVGRAVDRAGRERNIDVQPGAPVLATADPLRVDQVLENLLENAARYSPPTEPIEVEISEDGRFAVVSVRDHGPGVDETERSRIFEPFFRGAAGRRSSERGVGLGLAICQGLIEAQGGTLAVEPTEGGGACFTFSLPLA